MTVIHLFVPPDAHALELAGLQDAFFEANQRLPSSRHYQLRMVAAGAGQVRCASGLQLVIDHGVANTFAPADTLIIIGTYGIPGLAAEPVLEWLRQSAASARRFGSVCTGAFLLGATGLMDGRHVTTHWQYAGDLAARFPTAYVDPNRIFVRDGPLFTSAGSSAAIDLALALIEEDHGRPLALWVARRLVVYLKRPGGQSQFSVPLAAQAATRSPIEKVQEAIRENPTRSFSLVEMAHVAAMSQRNFSRVFLRETGISASDFLELTRIEMARRLLEDSDLPVQHIILRSGFSSPGAGRRAFQRRLGLTPSEYRERFRTAGDGRQ